MATSPDGSQEPLRVLLLGSGGREHALAAGLARSPRVSTLVVAPGNPGTAAVARNVTVDLDDHAAVLALARAERANLVVVGPEAPLVSGLVDALTEAAIPTFGPRRAAARLEGSKGFTKDLCRARGIPTAAYARFDDLDKALAHLETAALPLVVKADGLAAGKGVVVARSRAEARSAVEFMFGGGFGAAGASVVIENFLVGEEISFFALCDGEGAVPLGSARDYKRVGDDDTGPNTGGMGAVSPAPAMTEALEARIMAEIVRPTLTELRERGTPFRGVLFAGLMLTEEGPQLIEYNVRFGDPEAQAILPRLDDDLAALLHATATGRLRDTPPRFRPDVAVAVVLAANGYPEAPVKATTLRGVEDAAARPDVTVFHAGTRHLGDKLVADAGRVLTVTALGRDAAEARGRVYAAVDAIDWPGGFCRRDIGAPSATSRNSGGG